LDLILLWIIPKYVFLFLNSFSPIDAQEKLADLFKNSGAWLVGSAYMIGSIGSDLVSGLDSTSRSKNE
jgi:hypothetical protein